MCLCCRCPLYSDLEVIHDVAVQEEGIKAKEEIQAANPDVELKHDPTQSGVAWQQKWVVA